MRKNVLITAVMAVAALVGFTGTASATSEEANGTHVSAYDQFRPEHSGTGTTIGWQTVPSDSPLDNNSKALVVHVPSPTPPDPPYEFADAFTRHSININQAVGRVRNLSFDFLTTTGQHVGAGAPRISVIFGNGDIGYLAGFYCNNPLAIDPDWSRADFTGAPNNCTVIVTGATGGSYSADGTNSAWKVYATAHPSQTVKQAYMVFDEAGDYTIDRIAMGSNWLYNNSNTVAFNCRSREARC
jgi:hypothetical protein